MIETITSLNGTVNGFVWGPFGLALLFAAGLCMTIRNRGFQFAHFAHWMRNTIGAIFTDKHITAHTSREDKAISQFQSLCTALADTFNGLMMIPNLIGVLTLSGTVARITKNYVDRTFHGAKIRPMWSAFDEYQNAEEAEEDLQQNA